MKLRFLLSHEMELRKKKTVINFLCISIEVLITMDSVVKLLLS